jgi:formylmethanofuran dehydrogenase subunit A
LEILKTNTTNITVQNATVWTNEKEGILTETDVLVKNGKLLLLETIYDASATIIDAKGKHLTSGIIDEHPTLLYLVV